MSAAVSAPTTENTPVVESFAVAAQVRMTGAGTTARLIIALPEDVKVTPADMVPTMLTLGQRVLEEYRLTGQELPEVEVTAVERVETIPATAAATGFTVGVANDLQARTSSIVLDSDLLLGNDGGVLLAAATLLAGAAHLLDPEPVPARKVGRKRQPDSRNGQPDSRNRRRRGRGRR